MMSTSETNESLTRLGEDFWHFRGQFKAKGLVDLGTQASLVRLESGDFVFLDSYTLPEPAQAEVDRLTDGGARISAILNLHPFHTLHCEWMHRTYPHAALYGTKRHLAVLPDLPWQEDHCESPALAREFGSDFDFKVPAGVPLVCDDESVHFSSVLAYHRRSGTIHVDDTLMYLDKNFPISLSPINQRLDFHPTLTKALKEERGAAVAFREWAIALGIDWADAKRVAAAHNSVLELGEQELPTLIGEALGRVKPVLDSHRKEFG